MVTRVDKKPIIYNSTLIRCVKPAVVSGRKETLELILNVSVGHRIPDVSSRSLLDDYDDVEYALKAFGVDDPAYKMFSLTDDVEDDECIRIARMCLNKAKTVRAMMRNINLMEEVVKVQKKIFDGCKRCYYGTEAMYQVYNQSVWGNVFEKPVTPNYAQWSIDTAKQILLAQSTYMLIHPTAIDAVTKQMGTDIDYRIWNAWNMFKQIETAAIRIGSRKNMLAHAYYSGISKKSFEPSGNIEEDFLLPVTGYSQVKDNVKIYMVLGLRYYKIDDCIYVLSHDDCINLATMAQCYFRVALYFQKSNGYPGVAIDKALSLVKDISAHCCRLIDAKKNFSHIIRSMHILSQGEFNDSFEDIMGTDLGWKDRSANYIDEAKALDPMGITFHNRALSLAIDKMDKLNVCFIYHAFIGDEMHIDDLREKVKTMPEKVRGADSKSWSDFLKFVKAYTLCRYMMVNKKKPRCAGEIYLLNSKWADRCVSGTFTMPPHSDWGKVWIKGELRYTEFADTWHLEAQDVAYVMKDSKGVLNNAYQHDRICHSELLMAMTHGHILDTRTGSTPRSVRDRICSGVGVNEVVVTTAPKAENAKPSWKKRVTFAADCEFRKMQAEFDRNFRKVMTFIRGPSLGVDQCILEKQFADICDATATGLNGAICSHDISAWSESMDRGRKFEFEAVMADMFDVPDMIKIENDWASIKGVVNKQGAKSIYPLKNSSFQGFDGSSSTLLHSFILIYCIDTARRAKIMPASVKTNMATLIDDCIALMVDLSKQSDAVDFWVHLKSTYNKLGFEVDDIKSLFSTIKAIYLSRRFLLGGEVPSDLKVFIKAHSSYEDPLRCSIDIPNDIFGAMRGAADANGDCWFIYFQAVLSTLCELAHSHNSIMKIAPQAAAIFALAPHTENGWGFPSIISWSTNDVTDKRSHFNAILELNAVHKCQPAEFQHGVDVYSRHAAKAIYAIKSQAWRITSYSNIFTNPFECVREGPMKPDMLRRNAVQDILASVATAEPWKSLLQWNNSSTTARVRELLIQSGPLHAPTLSALVNCMPDNYRLSMVGKAIGSESLLSLIDNGTKVVLKRRIQKCSAAYFDYSSALFCSSNIELSESDMASLTYIERTKLEREEFYSANGVNMIDHTFPDPVANFTVAGTHTGSVLSPNLSALRIWDKTAITARRTNQLISDRGMYVPRRSGRVWEVTSEHAKGWDTVSQRLAMGLAILARAEADGHRVEGLLAYFVKSWNELSNITPADTHLISIHGSIKRLDANPGSATHPIITHRNIARGFNNKFKSALDAIPVECQKGTGSPSHLHDFLAHETSMTALCVLMLSIFQFLGIADHTLSYHMATRQGCVVPISPERMTTHLVVDKINIEIMDGAENYGLLQSCPELAAEIVVPTMKASWVRMINALMNRDIAAINDLRKEMRAMDITEAVELLKEQEVNYSASVILAQEPSSKIVVAPEEIRRLTLAPTGESSRSIGDTYTQSVRTVGSKFTRTLTANQPRHVMAATAIRSIVWSRLKLDDLRNLGAILYQDPDADMGIVKRCSSTDFWRGPIAEINRMKGDQQLSELAMAAFRSVGIPHLHLTASNDPTEVCQSVASFFGAHLRLVTIIVSDLICSVVGRKNSDFEKPFTERVVTNNPSIVNAKMRKEHMNKLIDTNIKTLEDRVAALKAGGDKITHRGDKRVTSSYPRIVELRCRKYVYSCFNVDDQGKGSLDVRKLCDIISKCADGVGSRIVNSKMESGEVIRIDIPQIELSIDGIIDFMNVMQEKFDMVCGNNSHGWNADAGQVGIRMAYDTLMMDSQMVIATKYAISAAEIAPKLYRKVIVTKQETPKIVQEVPQPGFLSLDDSDDDEIDLLTADLSSLTSMFSGGIKKLAIPLWQALYTLVMYGMYTTADVNTKLGTTIVGDASPSSLREAHLEDFDDGTIKSAFSKIENDYLMSGLVFDSEWLDRDEADAYTTDEIHQLKGGFLF